MRYVLIFLITNALFNYMIKPSKNAYFFGSMGILRKKVLKNIFVYGKLLVLINRRGLIKWIHLNNFGHITDL